MPFPVPWCPVLCALHYWAGITRYFTVGEGAGVGTRLSLCPGALCSVPCLTARESLGTLLWGKVQEEERAFPLCPGALCSVPCITGRESPGTAPVSRPAWCTS